MSKIVSLANMLGLRPLDRVQINNRDTIAESRFDAGQGWKGDLPFWYFQRVMDDGMVEVRSPGGMAHYVEMKDICDVLHGEPVMVKAMPKKVFLERSALKHRAGQPGPECYEDAYVRYVTKDRWGRADDIAVSFVDDALNHENLTFNPVADGERQRITALARRTKMPVMSNTSSAYSADHGVASLESIASATARCFFKSALSGKKEVVERLSMAGAMPLRRAELNRL